MSSSAIEPPSARKRAKARIVFGEAVVDEVETSLTYSLSPQRQQTANHSSLTVSASSSLPSIDTSADQLSLSYRRPSPVHHPFEQIIGTELEKENESSAETPHSSAPKPKTRPARQVRSPLRRDLVKKTQDAINKASISVNQSLNAVRVAKQDSVRYRSQQTAKVREEWQEERAMAESFHEEAEKSRRHVLAMQRTLSSKYSKEKAQRRQAYRHQKIEQVDKEAQFKSAVYREHQRKLREEEERRRRQSVDARARLRQNHRLGAERIRLQQIQEESAIFEERHQFSVALRETTNAQAERRRKSFAFRNGDARRIRQLYADMEAERLRKEHESFELKWSAERDAEAYERQLEEERRKSLAARGEKILKDREQEQARRAKEQCAKHESYELGRAADRDVDKYKKQQEEARRESLAMRNREGLRQRTEGAARVAEQLRSESESFELKWAGEKDAEAYQRQLQEQRRASLAQRNAQAFKQREEVESRRQVEIVAEHETFELKWAGEKDAEAYQHKLEEERRQSLARRNKETKLQRDLENNRRMEALRAEWSSYALKFDGERDADEYKRKLEEERRKSLEARNAHAMDQRRQADSERSETLVKEHASYELKWAGEKDAEAYQRKLEEERRESLARRNKERLHHANVMHELLTIAREKETESLVLKWAGEEDAKAYLRKIEEERRQSLQHRGEQVRHQREIANAQHEEELMQAHQDEQLRSLAQKDVEAYKKACAERDRASLEYRRKEARMQRLEEEERRAQEQLADHANFELETLARTDVEEYVADCKSRRRLSLAFRAKEKRQNAAFLRKQQEEERRARSREVRHRLMDKRSADLARREARAKEALEAIRHAGCSFNPFMGLTD